jgi:vacuolar-type H+-ATPase subunit D/Vma8
MFDEIVNEIEEVNKKVEAVKQEAATKLKPLFQEFIQKHPEIESIRLTQYTPYFNDGDECIFRVCEPEFKFVSAEVDEDEYEEGYLELPYQYDSKWAEDFRKVCSLELYNSLKEFAFAVESLEDCLNTLFGDHVRVIITKSGVEVEEYDHG